MRCPNTMGKYGKVTNTEIKWSIISKSVMIIIFVEFIDQLIDYPINRASLTDNPSYLELWHRSPTHHKAYETVSGMTSPLKLSHYNQNKNHKLNGWLTDLTDYLNVKAYQVVINR